MPESSPAERMPPHWEQEYVEVVTAALPGMWRLAYLLCGDARRADDPVQQTFTPLYVHWPRIRIAAHRTRGGSATVDGLDRPD